MRVAVIGGGFSGLAAGVELSQGGHGVVLLEGRNRLGGRAYSFIDSKTGDVVDNGQHLFMGCYRNTIDFLGKIGCLDRLKFQPQTSVEFIDRQGQTSVFRCPPLPSPAHVLVGLFRMKGLSPGDKLGAIRVGRAINKTTAEADDRSLTVARWLDTLRQSDTIRQRFWYPVAIATLNEDPSTASAKMMKVVLREAFGKDPAGANIGMARVGLSDLYTEGARAFIESRGGRVRTSAQVSRLVVESGRAAAAELKSGERVEADYFVSAVPHHALLQIAPAELSTSEMARIAALDSSPIVSINLWFDRPVTDREFVGLLGTKIQWLFNKDLIVQTGKQANQIALIISAARDFVERSKEELVEMGLDELRELVPESRSAKLIHSVVVKEREATLSHTVESDGLRPGPRTSIANLILAGDWIDTGMPATIESAVLSGKMAAACIDSSAGE